MARVAAGHATIGVGWGRMDKGFVKCLNWCGIEHFILIDLLFDPQVLVDRLTYCLVY